MYIYIYGHTLCSGLRDYGLSVVDASPSSRLLDVVPTPEQREMREMLERCHAGDEDFPQPCEKCCRVELPGDLCFPTMGPDKIPKWGCIRCRDMMAHGWAKLVGGFS